MSTLYNKTAIISEDGIANRKVKIGNIILVDIKPVIINSSPHSSRPIRKPMTSSEKKRNSFGSFGS